MGRQDRSSAKAAAPSWLEPLCKIPISFRGGNKSVYQLLTEINPDLSDRLRFIELVSGRLKNDPALVEAWQGYSYDKRVDSGPYLDRTKVGYYEQGEFRDKRSHPTPASACADFIFREAESVLHPKPR